MRKKSKSPASVKLDEILQEAGLQTKKKSKYGNVPTTIDGIRFDSKAEANFYCDLKILKRVGEVKEFSVHVRFPLIAGITYEADFVIHWTDGRKEIVDVKGSTAPLTEVFKLKMKLFEHVYPNKKVKVERR